MLVFNNIIATTVIVYAHSLVGVHTLNGRTSAECPCWKAAQFLVFGLVHLISLVPAFVNG